VFFEPDPTDLSAYRLQRADDSVNGSRWRATLHRGVKIHVHRRGR
jgi:hypothetical protein